MSVRLDPAARTPRVEAAATLGEFDRDAQAFALATPVGVIASHDRPSTRKVDRAVSFT